MDKSKTELKNKTATGLTLSQSDLCMCVILDIPARTERIIVGSQRDIQKNARKINNSNSIMFDDIRELGQLFLDIREIDIDKWKSVLDEMKNNLSYFRALSNDTMDFLESQNNDSNPINIYLALSTRKEYYRNKDDFSNNVKKDIFHSSVSEKTSFLADFRDLVDFLSFDSTNTKSESQLPDIRTIHKEKEYVNDYVIVWYPNKNRETEYIFSAGNIVGFLDFYAGILQKKNLKYQICDSCGKYFMTKSKKKKLCSESCKIAKKNIAQLRYKEAHAQRPEENAYNRLRRAMERYIDSYEFNGNEKVTLEKCEEDILNIARKGKWKVFENKSNDEVFNAKTTVYRKTFKEYLDAFKDFSTINNQSVYREYDRRRTEDYFNKLWPTLLQYSDNLEEGKTTLEEYKQNVRMVFKSFEDLKKRLNKHTI